MFTVHAKVTESRVVKMIRSNETKCENKGICLCCGRTIDGCEPDMRHADICPGKSCKASVYGPDEILVCGYYAGTVMGKSALVSKLTAEVAPEILNDAHEVEVVRPLRIVSAEVWMLDAEIDELSNEIDAL